MLACFASIAPLPMDDPSSWGKRQDQVPTARTCRQRITRRFGLLPVRQGAVRLTGISRKGTAISANRDCGGLGAGYGQSAFVSRVPFCRQPRVMPLILLDVFCAHHMRLQNLGLRGGGSGIRTLGTLSRPPVFKTGAFDHSAKPPRPPLVDRLSRFGKHTDVTQPMGKIADFGTPAFSGGPLQANVASKSPANGAKGVVNTTTKQGPKRPAGKDV